MDLASIRFWPPSVPDREDTIKEMKETRPLLSISSGSINNKQDKKTNIKGQRFANAMKKCSDFQII